MNFTRMTAISAITLAATFGLGACAEKPLSNEEACQEIINQAKEQNLDTDSTGSLGDTVEQGKKISAIFRSVADQAEAEFSADLAAYADNTDEFIAVVSDDSLSTQQMQVKMSLLDTAENRALSDKLETTCPGLNDL
ncbi:hypothetical protein CQ010_14075 [Arthrobacter sp. MYb211]|nr:hypothetical protein CQ015_14305 [Arthrobacter sp. MYb221]PRC05813.1 hypothetical protein CQ010_14075 [Arthrobacter sp. MYb211]